MNISLVISSLTSALNNMTHAELREQLKARLLSAFAWQAASSKERAASMEPLFNAKPNTFKIVAEDNAATMQLLPLGIADEIHVDRPQVLKIMQASAGRFVEWKGKALDTFEPAVAEKSLGEALSHFSKDRLEALTALIDEQDAQAAERSKDCMDTLGKTLEASNAPLLGAGGDPEQAEIPCIFACSSFINGLEQMSHYTDLSLVRKQKQALNKPRVGKFALRRASGLAALASKSIELDMFIDEVFNLLDWMDERADWLMTPEGERIDADLKEIDNALDGWGTEADGNIGGQSDNNDRS